MNNASWIAGLLALACVPASGATAQASIDVRFVVAEACTIRAHAPAAAPAVACNSLVPRHILARAATGPAPAAQQGWTIYF